MAVPATRAASGYEADEARRLAVALLAAVGVTLLLESMRVFVSYLVFVLDQSARVPIATTVVVVILALGFGGVLLRGLGLGRVVLVAALLLGLVRLVTQLVEVPGVRLLLGAGGVVSAGWLLLALLARRRPPASLGVAAGLALDLAIRIAFRGVDLPWMPGGASDAVTLVLLGALVAPALWGLRAGWGDDDLSGGGAAASLLILGPALGLYHLTLGNLGLAQAQTGLSFRAAAVLLALGTTLGLRLATARLEQGRYPAGARPFLLLGVVVVLAGAVVLLWSGTALGALSLILGPALALPLLSGALDAAPGSSPGRPALWFTLGMLLEVAILFAYYTFTGAPLIAGIMAAIFLAAALAGNLPSRPETPPAAIPVALGAALLLLLALALQLI